jgi:hypothetical protein
MEGQKQAPLALKVVAAFFILSGVLAALEILISLTHQIINFNFGALGIFVGLGLLRFRCGWRTRSEGSNHNMVRSSSHRGALDQ